MKRGLVTDNKVPKVYEELVEPHVASFDYFLSEGIQKVVKNVDPVERMTYAAPLEIDINFGGFRITKSMGSLPIMVKSLACHLRGASKSDLVSRGEEANDFGGYFIAGGNEKCVRILITPKRHYAMAVSRRNFTRRGPLFSEKAVVFRSVREDEHGSTLRCHYLRDGTVQTSFPIGWTEFFAPSGVLLKALMEVSDREIFDQLCMGASSKKDGSKNSHAVFVAERAELLLRQSARFGFHTKNNFVEYLGSYFRVQLHAPKSQSDHDVGHKMLSRYIFGHLTNMEDKYNLLIEMIQKLYAFENGICCDDNDDALAAHECRLPGMLFTSIMADLLKTFMATFQRLVNTDLENSPETVDLYDDKYVSKILQRCADPCKKLDMLVKTGNFKMAHSRDCQQSSGFVVVAERINFCRFLAHFRALHRGSIFVEMKVTTPRKLLPESWGFVCPVHTPDGGACGLLQHFTANCKIIPKEPHNPELLFHVMTMVLTTLGMAPLVSGGRIPGIPEYLPVMMNGKLIGHMKADRADNAVARLRVLKSAVLCKSEGTQEESLNIPGLTEAEELVPSHLEIAYFPFQFGGPYPGILMFFSSCMLMRKVLQTRTNTPEMIGPLEQTNLNILCPGVLDEECGGVEFTHKEIHTRNILSVMAGLTPFSDYNQSPRNMYQCQMLKQTMGTPCQDLAHRTDNKLYWLHTPQSPIARAYQYDQHKMDEYPSGTNAVVAVLAHTGYDMEDAMILNKSSVERGFAHGSVYKTQAAFLSEDASSSTHVFGVDQTARKKNSGRKKTMVSAFGDKLPLNIPTETGSPAAMRLGVQPLGKYVHSDKLDVDGLPHPGAIIWPGECFYSTVDYNVGKHNTVALKGEEIAVVDSVTVVGKKTTVGGLTCANIRLRFNRNPVIGDKFASRAGQKGILAQKWPDVNMPYCAMTGMRPDLVINPHAFPSRMTIGMLVESLASKGGALEGKFVDCSPFRKCDEGEEFEDPVKVFGECLEREGFSRSGTETMINGMTGEEMKCDIYIGLVYYQRLRHMVSDKFQCRSTGPINAMTRQPVQGRKAGGGIRLGEMERDSLIAHGASYTLHDRLNISSDHQVSNVCAKCGSLLGTLQKPIVLSNEEHRLLQRGQAAVDGEHGAPFCMICDSGEHIHRVPVPYVWKLLVSELAAMNIKISMDVKSSTGR